MKKIFVYFSLFILGSSFCLAQDSNLVKKFYPSRKGFSLEPVAGIGTSEAVQGGTNNTGWKMGMDIDYMFNNHFGIASGLILQKYTTSFNSITDSIYYPPLVPNNPAYPASWSFFTAKIKYKFTYLKIPFNFRYITSKCRKTGIFIEGGIAMNVLLYTYEPGNMLINTESYVNPLDDEFDSVSMGTKANATVISLEYHIAFGLFIPLNNKYSITLAYSQDNGLTNVGNSKYDVAPGPFYYYNPTNPSSSEPINYGKNYLNSFDVSLNIKI